MRLHTLRFQAVGPFAGEHVIDFDQLSASGLFMLEGPTGSGKSTVIDAIVFALYGQVAGRDAVVSRMRSDHAAPEVDTYVELTFSTDTGIFRVRRTPEYQRPKKRGTGTTKAAASATLVRLAEPTDEAGVGVASRVDEVSAEVARLVGLSREQFTQVVVLPQGQFAQFLNARTADRAAVLQRVFGTEIYERVQEVLRAQAAAARARRADAVAELTARGNRFVEAAGCAPEAESALLAALQADDADAVRYAVAAELERLDDAVAGAAGRAEETQVARVAAEERLAAEESLAAALARRSALLQDQEQLLADAGSVAAMTARLDRAARARVVASVVSAWEDAGAGLTRAQSAVPRVLAEVLDGPDGDLVGEWRPTGDETTSCEVGSGTEAGEPRADVPAGALAGTSQGDGEPTVAEVEKLLGTARERHAALEPAEQLEADVARRRAAVEQDEAALPEQQALVEAARAANLTEEQEIEGLRTARQEALAEAADLEDAVEALAAARAAREAAERLDVARGRESAAEDALRERLQAEEASNAGYLRLRADWIAGQAARLAAELVPGKPCPVCGAAEHPAPAAAGEPVDDAELEAAQSTLSAATTAVVQASTRLDAAREEVAALAAGAVELDAATAAEDAASKRHRAARQAGVRAASLEKDIATREAALNRDRERCEQNARTLTQLEAGLSERRAALASDTERLVADRDRYPSVVARRTALRERVHRAETLRDTLRARDRAAERWEEAATRLAAALEEQGFADAAAATDAALPPAETSRMQAAVARHGNERHRVASGLAEPQIAALTGEERADVEAARQARDDARSVDQEARTVAQRADERSRDAHARGRDIEASLAEVARIDADSGPLVRMAALAAGEGGNAAHLALSTFVLVRRFEEVLAAANTRLSAMTGGRYEMVRTEEKEKGSRERKTGLGIDVVDHLTDRPRSPASLSGGETFQFSLCLALGLADVVSEENGSIEMGTLFVDEGFGSLDADSLDVVMRELTALHQRGNRAVGVVSHVTEMKAQIAERIEVQRTARGSTLKVIA